MKSLDLNFKTTSLLTFFLASFTLLLSVGAPAQQLSSAPVFASLIADQKTAVPGRVLNPGSYSIRIIDHLKDRYIVQVNDVSGDPIVTFIGLHNPEFDSSIAVKEQGPILWNAAPKGQVALRGFSFSNGNTLEFVYPKAEAVTLAKLNTNSVPAIDPESEGRKPDPKLSPEDREVVTLWMLNATRVGPKADTPAIAAKRFVAPPDVPSAAPVQVASTTPVPVLQSKQSRPAPLLIAKAQPTEAPRVRSSVKKLPQTASNFSLLLLLAVFSLFAAAVLRVIRLRA